MVNRFDKEAKTIQRGKGVFAEPTEKTGCVRVLREGKATHQSIPA